MAPFNKLTDSFLILGIVLSCGLQSISTSPAEAQESTDSWAQPSYTRLADPKVADSMKLTDEQRSKVASLLTTRAGLLSKAALATRVEVLMQSEKDLAAVLTDEQQILFAKETAPARLRFNFRFQRWSDVLEWFAKQTDLSLVLDAPPPGTFNYSDTKEYSAVEGLDLLNGVLSTKGYTLIRRGRMLLVIDIQEGIPDGLIPRIPLDELDKRGKFELISVMFPLEDREPQTVKAEIAPLLGPFGKSVALPQTKQLLVTDTAGIMRAVSAVIASIPKPAAATTSPVPVPVLAVYPVKAADAKVAEDVLVKMFPAAKIVADIKAEQVNAFATPVEQEAIKLVVEQMQAHNPPEKKPRLEVYPVGNLDSAQLVTNLTLVAPTARITFDPRERQVIAFAAPIDHTNLKVAIDKLAAGGTLEKTRQLEVYRLSKADPATTLTLLQGLLPQAKFSLDPQTRRIIAVASFDDHKVINSILEQLQTTDPGPDTQILKFYPLDHPLPTTSMTILTTLAPKAQIVANPEAKQLQVLASQAEHALIKTNLEELLNGIPPLEKRQLTVYTVTASQRKRFQTVFPSLTTDFPEIRVMPEGEPTELAIWAKPSQHELLKGLLESLASELAGDAKPQLVTHPLKLADQTTVTSVLKSLVPDAKLSFDVANRNLVAIASVEDQRVIKSTVEKLQPGEMGPDAIVLRFYSLDKPLPATSMTAFAKLIPRASVTPDPEGKWLQVVASVADQELFKGHLDQLQKGLPAAEKRKLAFYPVTPAQRLRFQTILPSLSTDLPDIRVITGGEPNELAIWAKPSQHTVLDGIIEELKREVPEIEKYQLVSYPLKFSDPTTALTVLQTLFPGIKINVDTGTNRLLIWTRPADHPAIKQAIQELDSENAGERQDKVMVYPVPEIDPDVAVGLLQGILPKVRLMKDLKARTIVAWAKKNEHETIQRTLALMRDSAGGDQKLRLKIYPSGKFNATSLLDVLKGTIPGARISVDTKTGGLAVLGTAADHVEIQSAIEQMTVQSSKEGTRLVTYTLTKIGTTSAISLLTQAAPEAKFSVGQDSSQLLVWAKPEDHTVVEKIIEQMESEGPQKSKLELQVYTVRATSAAVAIPMLTRVVPKAIMNVGGDPNRIIAWAFPSDHEVIGQVIKQLDAEHTNDSIIEFYELQNVDSDAALRLVQAILQKQVAGSMVTLIQGTNQLFVEARPEQHEMIQAGLKRLKSTAEMAFEVFQLEKVDTFAADSLIRRMFSGSKLAAPIVEADAAQQRLYVRGTKEQLVRVRELLEKFGESTIDSSSTSMGRRVRVIPFGGDSSAAMSEIQRVWPQLRSNELRVIAPSHSKHNLLQPKRKLEDQIPIVPTTKRVTNEVKTANSGDPDHDRKEADRDSLFSEFVAMTDKARADSQTKDSTLSDETKGPSSPIRMDMPTEGTANRATGADNSDSAPIVVLPRDGSITILSDDAEALDQLDRLLRSLSSPKEVAGRGFAVFALKYAGASSVVDTLKQVLRISTNSGTARSGSGPTVVADDRLNAIVVHASRSDRAAIEMLIEVLDSSEIPDSNVANRPKRVSVKNGSATQIEQVLRLVYKTQLTTGGGRKELPIPTGLAPEIAAAMQQMNAMNMGPLLALSVDDVTNSIVIMAPTGLAEQVSTLIEELDQAALNENQRGLTIIPTQRMNSSRAQKALNLILEKSRQRTKRP